MEGQGSSSLSLSSATPTISSSTTKLQETLLTSKRVSERSKPSVEEKMTAQGFTIHKLNFPSSLNNGNMGNSALDDPSSLGFDSEEMTKATASETEGSSSSFAPSTIHESSVASESNSVLYGRDDEIAMLQRLAEECSNEKDEEEHSGSFDGHRNKEKFELCFITGETGVGKTVLALQLRKHLQEQKMKGRQQTYYFCMGKYDQTFRGIPFVGVHAAMKSLSYQILQAPAQEQERIRNGLCKMLGLINTNDKKKEGLLPRSQDFSILAEIVPNLDSILRLDNMPKSTTFHQRGRASFGLNKVQLHVLFHRFLKVVCNPKSLLVMCLDDLQWADVASLELIEALVQEKTIPGLLLVGLYRINEVSEDHPLNRVFKVVNKSQEHVHMTNIEIGNLGLPHVKRLLSHILNDQYPSKEKLDQFAEILQRKSGGNPFFMTQLLKQLQRTDALKFNLGTMKWHWDDAIEHEVKVTDNVASFMEANLQACLSPSAAWILQIGACLGSSFEEDIMVSLLQGFASFSQNSDISCAAKDDFVVRQFVILFGDSYGSKAELQSNVLRSLEECVGFTFLSKHLSASNRVTYHFAHDKVQEAATHLIGAKRVDSLCHYIGWTLVDCLPTEKLEEHLFVAVDGINRKKDSKTEVVRKILDLNLQAGIKAMSISAFESAALYFDEASTSLRLIESVLYVAWTDYEILRPLGLELFTNGARAQYCAGNMDGCMQNLKEILLQPSIPIEEKLDAYAIQSEVLTVQEKHTEEFKTSLDVLRLLGVKFPPKPLLSVGILADLHKTKSALRKMSADDLINLPDMQEETRCKTMKILDRATNVSYMLGDPHLTYLVFRQIRWTAAYGVGPTSANMFCGYSNLLISMGNFKQAAEYGKVGMALADREICASRKCRTIMIAYMYVFPWTTSTKSCLKPLLEGHEIGMKKGDLENAFYCSYAYILNGNAAGVKLPIMKQDIVDFQRQMFVYHQDHTYKMSLPHLQFVLKMIDNDSKSSLLTGEIMDFDALMEHLVETNHVHLLDLTRSMQLQLAFYFGNIDLAWKMGNESKSTEKTCLGQVIVWRRVFFVGLANFALARRALTVKTKRAAGVGFQSLKKEGLACLAKMKAWVKGGNVNCIHLLRILEAESLSLPVKKRVSQGNDISSAYDAAIVASSRSGFVHDRALCYELAVSHLIEAGATDSRQLSDYQQQALSAYHEWGALAKCQELKDKWMLK